MILTSCQKRIMITQSQLTVVMRAAWPWSPPTRQGMQYNYKTYSNRTRPFFQSNYTPLNPGHRNDKSYLFLPNQRCKWRSFARVDLRAAMFSLPLCIAGDGSSRLFHDLSRNHAGHQSVQNYARNQLGCGRDQKQAALSWPNKGSNISYQIRVVTFMTKTEILIQYRTETERKSIRFKRCVSSGTLDANN